MAFMLSLGDIKKARSIAERALRTINKQEETEKLNVWVAYFNLENEYGNPSERPVMKVFQRALQSCDPEKVHFALLGMFERTEQHELADELLDEMTKKYKESPEVWLRRVQWVLKQCQDEAQVVVNRFQAVVKRALLSLPCNEHINFITQTAILEFKWGVAKDMDLWGVYLDQVML